MSDTKTEDLLLRMAAAGDVSVSRYFPNNGPAMILVTWLGERHGSSTLREALNITVQAVYDKRFPRHESFYYMILQIEKPKGSTDE